MKHIFCTIAVTLGLAFSAGASEVLLEDDFMQGEQGPIYDRAPAMGNPWQGLAVTVGDGLVHGGDVGSRAAVARLDIPADAKQLTAVIKGVYRAGGQFRFGFTNNPIDILGEDEFNRGLVWANLAGGRVFMHAGEYANGEKIDAAVKELRDGESFELEFTATLVPEGEPVPMSFSFNGQHIVQATLLPTATPNHENFFIQFTGEVESVNDSTIFEVKVVAD